MPLSSYRDEFDEAISFAEREQLAEPGALSMRELPGVSSGDEFDEAIASLSVESQEGLAIARPQTLGTEHGFLGEITAGLGRGALRVAATPAYLADVVGEATGWEGLEKAGERGAERVEKFIKERPGLRKSVSISGDIRKNPQLWKDPNWYASIVSEGIPTVFSMLIPGMGAARGAKALGWGVKGIKAARVAGGLGAAMGLEAGGAAEQARQYEKATGEEIPIGKKLQAVIGTGVVAGSLEYTPIFRIFGKSAGRTLVKRVLEAMAIEGSTEGAQEIVANHFAKIGYDADQDMAQGIIESIVGGVLIGGGMGGLAGPAKTFQDQIEASTTPENVERISHAMEEGEREALLDRFRKGSTEDLVSLRQSSEGAEYAKELDQVIGEKQVEPVYDAAKKRVGLFTPGEQAEREYQEYQPDWQVVKEGEGIAVMAKPEERGLIPRKETGPKALPPGQGFDLLPPKPKTKLRPSPEKIEGPTYPEGAEYVAGKEAPEELDVEHKPVLTIKEKPFKKKENALRALKSKRLASKGITPETHKIVSVKGGFGIIKKVVETVEDRRKTAEAFEKADKAVREKYTKEAPSVPQPKTKPKKVKSEKVKGKTLIAFVRVMGGIKDASLPGEIRALSAKETGVVGLTTKRTDKGLGFDEMAAAAVEYGWLPENLENESGAFSELLRDDIFAQKEGRQRVERQADVAKKSEREERWKEFERSEDEELEYFAKHPEEEINADLDQWQRESIIEIRRLNDVRAASEIEESAENEGKAEAKKETPGLVGSEKDEGWAEFSESWDENDALDEDTLAELEEWRVMQEGEGIAVMAKEGAKEEKLKAVSEKVKAETPTMLKESDKVNDVTLGTLVDMAAEDPAKALEHAADATVSKAKLIEGLKNKGLKAMGEAKTKEERAEIKKNLGETLRGIEEGKPKGKIVLFDDLNERAKGAIASDAMGKGQKAEEFTNSEWLHKTVDIESLKSKNKSVWDDSFVRRKSETKEPLIVATDGEVLDGNNRLREAIERKDKQIDILKRVEKPKEPVLREPEAEYGKKTEGPVFKKWFKDSKAVDEKGEPLVVYHGTVADFTEFKDMGTSPRTVRWGRNTFFFTDNPDLASDYAEIQGEGANVIPVYLSIKDPLIIDAKGKGFGFILKPNFIKHTRWGGHDSIIIKNVLDRPSNREDYKKINTVYIALSPTQIKSAIGNIGTFSETDPSILREPAKGYRQSELDIAFGGKKKADEAIESVAKGVEAVSRRGMPDRVARKPAKSKVAEEMRKNRRVDLTGRKLTTGNESQEIAELFQVYRSPKMEILHTIYTSKDGVILGHNAITSGNMGAVSPKDGTKYIYQMQSTAKRLGAAKVHILHNHPSGNPTMSQNDVVFAANLHAKPTLERNALGDLMGEFIVIDHGKFTWVSHYFKSGETYVDEGTYKVTPYAGKWMLKKGPLLTGPKATATLGQSLAFDESKACFVYVDGGNNVVGWSTHNKDILKKENLREIVKQQAKGHDAAKAVILVHDIKDVKRVVTWAKPGLESWLLDAQDAKGYSLREALPLSFERRGRREPTKPAWGLFEPEAEYGKEHPTLTPGAQKLLSELEELKKEHRPPPLLPEGVESHGFGETLEPVTTEDYTANRKESKDIKLIARTSARRGVSEMTEGVDKFLGSISTRLGQVSPKLKAKIRKLDFDINTKYADDVKVIHPLLKKAKKMSSTDFADWDYARKNSDIERISELIDKYNLQKEYKAYREVLDNLRNEGLDVGLAVGQIDEYAPRLLKDSRGFLTAIGKAEEWPIYFRKLQERANELGVSVAKMPSDMKADIISNMILGGWSGLGGIPATKQRKLKKIPAYLNKYYMDSDAALMQHLYSMRKGIEARKFFGEIPKKVTEIRTRLYATQAKIREINKLLTAKPAEEEAAKLKKRRNKFIGLEKQYTAYIAKYALQRDYTENIGSYVMELIDKKEISPQHERVVNEILNARFHEAGTRGLIQAYKNLSYIDTMGSPISALTQIGDLAWAAYEGGFIRAGKYAFKAAIGKSRITKEDVGVTRIAQEFADSGTLGKAVTNVFKIVGLEKIDSIGKESLLNSALEVYQKQAKDNPAKLKKRIRPIFEAETDSVVEDLVNDEISENVKLLVYSRLLDFQPVALSEMPQRYLDAGNGRLFYMLKTFTIKVFDVFRNESYNKIKDGNKAEKIQGIKNLVRLSMIFILANATADELKDWVLGRKTDFSDRAIDNILRLFGISKFVTWKARTEGVGSALARQILPPFKFIDSAGKDIITAGDEKGLEVIGSIPVVGKLAYWHIGRGVSKRSDLWDRRLRKRKAKLNKIKDRYEKTKNKTGFVQKHRKELGELRAINKLQGQLNKYRSRINRLKSIAETPKRKKVIQNLENKRTELIKTFLKRTEKREN